MYDVLQLVYSRFGEDQPVVLEQLGRRVERHGEHHLWIDSERMLSCSACPATDVSAGMFGGRARRPSRTGRTGEASSGHLRDQEHT